MLWALLSCFYSYLSPRAKYGQARKKISQAAFHCTHPHLPVFSFLPSFAWPSLVSSSSYFAEHASYKNCFFCSSSFPPLHFLKAPMMTLGFGLCHPIHPRRSQAAAFFRPMLCCLVRSAHTTVIGRETQIVDSRSHSSLCRGFGEVCSFELLSPSRVSKQSRSSIQKET